MLCTTKFRYPHLLSSNLKLKFKSFIASSSSSSSSHNHQWSGLQQWRDSPINQDRAWGPKGPQPPLKPDNVQIQTGSSSSLAELGALVLSTFPLCFLQMVLRKAPHWGFRPARPPGPTDYGDMPAHNLLWRECEKSTDNVAARLAAIPLVQEARGLDAGPRLVKKLIGFGDKRTSNVVARIADEEVAHVAVGVFWFISVCQKMGRVPCSTFKDLLKEYDIEVKGPFNYSAREEAGLPRHWYDLSSSNDQSENQLSEVYERLTHIIAKENENAGPSSRPRE